MDDQCRPVKAALALASGIRGNSREIVEIVGR